MRFRLTARGAVLRDVTFAQKTQLRLRATGFRQTLISDRDPKKKSGIAAAVSLSFGFLAEKRCDRRNKKNNPMQKNLYGAGKIFVGQGTAVVGNAVDIGGGFFVHYINSFR